MSEAIQTLTPEQKDELFRSYSFVEAEKSEDNKRKTVFTGLYNEENNILIWKYERFSQLTGKLLSIRFDRVLDEDLIELWKFEDQVNL